MKPIISILVLGMCLFLVSCDDKDPQPPSPDPSTSKISTDGCKQFKESTRAGKDDCFEYTYDGSNTLSITHINAAFNCCPGELTAHSKVANGTIKIEEKETEAQCFCNCLYDLTYKISNITPGKYTLKVIEPYVDSNSDQLEFTVDLTSSTSGTYCVNRTTYPWGF